MFKRVPSKEEQLLAERLRREAMESRPAFSESLHRRILTAVKQQNEAETQGADSVPLLRRSIAVQDPLAGHCLCQAVAHDEVKRGRTASRRWPRMLAATLAAACLLCAVAIGWQLLRHSAPQDPGRGTQFAGPSINELPSINDWTDRTVGRLDHLSVSAAFEPQTTHLKHDASAVASVFLDRLPVNVKVAENR
jgi:hypothetical protein